MSLSRDFALWIGILGGPAVWLISFEALFALNPWACTFQTKLYLYLVSLIAFALSFAAGLLAWREWTQLGREVDPKGGDTLARSRSMAFAGILLSFFSCLIILAQAIAEIILGACQ
ncbi:MAG: hypothetical protein JO091_01210 [Acidobacteriaceae bacterium]|nr:hypothetical protein [Acidobacteriaceae bacterium]